MLFCLAQEIFAGGVKEFLEVADKNIQVKFLVHTWNCTHTELHLSFKKCIKSFCRHKTHFLSDLFPWWI